MTSPATHTGFVILFWFSIVSIFYVYIGYPLLLYFFSHKRSLPDGVEALPHVTLLISAYNEQGVIAEKLRNTLALDYPHDRMRIIVVSDCSDDGTDKIVELFSSDRVCLVRQPRRLGKSAGLNLGVQHASGEILFFSDANSMYRPDAVRNLVRHFVDSSVGYAVGNCAYKKAPDHRVSAQSEGLYWRLETWLKEKESDFGSVVGGDGAIYAIRRELFIPLQPTDINDFVNPLQIIARGYRGVYDATAICYEEAGDNFGKEFHRKVRIISRSLNAVCRVPQVLLPWNQPRHWFALMSHKVLRWVTPVFLIFALLASLFLWETRFYRFTLALQIGFYFLAGLGGIIQAVRKPPRILYLPYYFCLMNVASLIGLIKFGRGSLSPTWQTIRHEGSAKPAPAVPVARKES